MGKMFHSSRLRGPNHQLMQGNIAAEKIKNWYQFTSTEDLLKEHRQLEPTYAPAGATTEGFEN